MIRLSFGPRGEFFIESSQALSPQAIEAAEDLYKRIMNARTECDILNEAMRDINEERD